MHKIPKLPQARLYLKSARWGLDKLVEEKFIGYPFRFHMVGILASLRTVQHALYNSDRKISPAHKKVIEEWWQDPTPQNAPELKFIKTARDLILKEGSFEAYATLSESGTGEGDNYKINYVDYDLAYYDGKVRYDLFEKLKSATAWCEHELATIEAKLPDQNECGNTDIHGAALTAR